MSTQDENQGDHGMDQLAHAADRRWTVLFIGDHGKVIAFKRIRTLAVLTIAALVTALATVIVLVSVNQGLHGRTRDLQKRLESSQQEIQTLRQERDLLTAHVVLCSAFCSRSLVSYSGWRCEVIGPDQPGLSGLFLKRDQPLVICFE